jgi:dUTP pyrophosphatase
MPTIELKPTHAVQGVDLTIQLLSPCAMPPAYQTDGAAGMDLFACLPEGVPFIELIPLARGGRAIRIPLGFAMAIPHSYEAQIRPRSGLATNHGITLPNAPGTIDADYRGEVQIPLINLGQEPFQVTHAMRIAQMLIAPVVRANVTLAATLPATSRGAGGFGSTGH